MPNIIGRFKLIVKSDIIPKLFSQEDSMVNLLIASKESYGKTALCAGIAKKLVNQGKKVGYFLPVRLSEFSALNDYKDATFVKGILELEESPELISPVSLSSSELWKSLTETTGDFIQQVKKNYARISRGKDVVVIEGLSGLAMDNVATLACYRIAEALDARVVAVLPYAATLSPSEVGRVAEELRQKLLGVVINFVPEFKIEAARQNLADSFQKAGIKVLCVLPETRSLLGISVKELAAALNGDIVTCPENADELVENIMLGAMTLDSGIDYFSRKKDKAAIIRGERPDMQLAALQTPTKCLVLTNATKPIANVVAEAENKKVPVVVVPNDASSALANIEQALVHSAFNSPTKLKKLEELLDKYLDFKSLSAALGL